MDTVGEWRRMKERLQKLIASAGLCARRTAEEWIAAGRVRVNGEVAVIGGRADPETDTRHGGRQAAAADGGAGVSDAQQATGLCDHAVR